MSLPGSGYERTWEGETLAERMRALVTDLNVCSNKGLSERFDSTIGAATALMPFGGTRQLHAGAGHGGEAARVDGETTTAARHGLGLQPVPHGGEPVHGRVHRRGGERGEAGGRRFRARGHAT